MIRKKAHRDELDETAEVIEGLSHADVRTLYENVQALGFDTATEAVLDGPGSSAIFSSPVKDARLDLIFAILGLDRLDKFQG